jgi:hypothetical protein
VLLRIATPASAEVGQETRDCFSRDIQRDLGIQRKVLGMTCELVEDFVVLSCRVGGLPQVSMATVWAWVWLVVVPVDTTDRVVFLACGISP